MDLRRELSLFVLAFGLFTAVKGQGNATQLTICTWPFPFRFCNSYYALCTGRLQVIFLSSHSDVAVTLVANGADSVTEGMTASVCINVTNLDAIQETDTVRVSTKNEGGKCVSLLQNNNSRKDVL